MRIQKNIKIVFLLILAILAGMFVFILGRQAKKDNLSADPKSIVGAGRTEIGDSYQSLNGSKLADESSAGRRPLAVVVENYPDARPQSGLAKADLVYETVAEGGITRFLAVFQTQKAENIGPVRSARTYFADIADELGAVFAHVGGNSDVLENIKLGDYPKLLDLDQFFQDKYFHRIFSRPMPHNVYSSTDKLFSFISDRKNPEEKKYAEWLFADQFSGNEPAEKIDIQFSLPDYAVSYVYDGNLGAYKRYLAGRPHLDAEGNSGIYAKNVVVQSVRTWPVKTDTLFSFSMDLLKGGPAYVFSQGRGIVGTWKKSLGERTRYYDGQGKEIKFSGGATWVELVPEEKIGELKWTGKGASK